MFKFIETGFDDTVVYKGLTIHRTKVSDGYYHIKLAGESLTVSLKMEKDLDLLGLPYLTYMYKKKDIDPYFSDLWNYMIFILAKSFRDYYVVLNEQTFEILEKTDLYDKYEESYIKEFERLKKYIEKPSATMTGVNMIQEKILDLENKMYNRTVFNETEFDEIRDIICTINGFDNAEYDPKWEFKLLKAKEVADNASHDKEGLTITDLVESLAFYLRKLPHELKDMSYYTFNHYVKMMGEYDEYLLCRTAQLQGTEFKESIKHWLSHYTPKGKYDDLVTQNASAIKSVQ